MHADDKSDEDDISNESWPNNDNLSITGKLSISTQQKMFV